MFDGVYLRNIALSAYSYFYPSNKKNDGQAMEEDLEVGTGVMEKKVSLEPMMITAEEVLTCERNNMVPPAEAPGTAAGDYARFMIRQKHLLEDKYQDRAQRTVTTTGNIVHGIIKRAERAEGCPSILDNASSANLELITSGNSVTSYIQRVQTKMGRAVLHTTVTRPSTDVVVVSKRQKVISALVDKPVLWAELKSHLQILGKGEKALLSCWDREVQLPGFVSKMYYALHPKINEMLNKSGIALDAYGISLLTKRVAEFIIQGVIGGVFPLYVLTELYEAVSGNESPSWLNVFVERFMSNTVVGGVGAAALVLHWPLINAALAAAGGTMAGLAIPTSWNWMKTDCEMFPLMREVLTSIANYCNSMKEIKRLLDENGLIEEFPELAAFLEESSGEVKLLLDSLSSFTFQEGTCYRIGELLQAWELLHSSSDPKPKKKQQADVIPSTEPNIEDLDAERDLIEEVERVALSQHIETQPKAPKANRPPASGDIIRKAFEKVLLEMGKLDMLVSCATLVRGSEKFEAKFSLAQFMQGDQPQIEAKGVWNPMIARRRAIVNDITLRGKGISVTGMNGEGKSFGMKGLMAAIVMGQSLGIVPASEMTFTPFAYIGVSANISDSADKKVAGHEAQSKRIAEIRRTVEQTTFRGGRTITFLDEPYIQTNEEEGKTLVRKAATDLNVEGNLPILVTHRRDIAEELVAAETYTALHVDGRKLQPGVATKTNGLEIAARFGAV